MGTSFKMFGADFAETLITFTSSPFVGLFVGILATALVQSSSLSTSIVVGLVASNALTVAGAIPIIMGANVGTSITNTIVSLAHIKEKKEFRQAFEVATVHDFFNFIVVLVFFPIEIIFHPLERIATSFTGMLFGTTAAVEFTSPLDLILKPVTGFAKELFAGNPIPLLIIALVLLFFSLRFFVKIMRPLAESEFKHKLDEHIFRYPGRTFFLGLSLTVLVQSSSVSTSLIVPLAGIGIVTLETIFPFILGANVGTTITALLASLASSSPTAITVALVHLLFNVFGSVVMYPFRKLPIKFSRRLAQYGLRHKVLPIVYIIGVFYVLPFLLILLFNVL